MARRRQPLEPFQAAGYSRKVFLRTAINSRWTKNGSDGYFQPLEANDFFQQMTGGTPGMQQSTVLAAMTRFLPAENINPSDWEATVKALYDTAESCAQPFDAAPAPAPSRPRVCGFDHTIPA